MVTGCLAVLLSVCADHTIPHQQNGDWLSGCFTVCLCWSHNTTPAKWWLVVWLFHCLSVNDFLHADHTILHQQNDDCLSVFLSVCEWSPSLLVVWLFHCLSANDFLHADHTVLHQQNGDWLAVCEWSPSLLVVWLFHCLRVNDFLHADHTVLHLQNGDWLAVCFSFCLWMISFMLITQYYTSKMVTGCLSVFLSVCEWSPSCWSHNATLAKWWLAGWLAVWLLLFLLFVCEWSPSCWSHSVTPGPAVWWLAGRLVNCLDVYFPACLSNPFLAGLTGPRQICLLVCLSGWLWIISFLLVT